MSGTVALISGGLDSTALLATLVNFDPASRPNMFPIHVLTFKYGSVHQDAETQSAKLVVEAYRESHGSLLGRHEFFSLPSEFFAGSALVDSPSSMPSGRSIEEMVKDVAPTYVPARNTIFLALAAGRADAWRCSYIAYAAHWEDAPGYPDCRPAYFEAMDHAIRLGTKNEVRVLAPFIQWSKSDIIERAMLLRAPLELTHSCYRGTKPACGVCDTCILRIESFKRLRLQDPVQYAIDIDWET